MIKTPEIIEPQRLRPWDHADPGVVPIRVDLPVDADEAQRQAMGDAVERTRRALEGLPEALGLVGPPPTVTLRPMQNAGYCNYDFDHGESIVLSPWRTDDRVGESYESYPYSPAALRFTFVHELAHYLTRQTTSLPNSYSHAPAFTAINVMLLARCCPDRINRLDLYDCGIDTDAAIRAGQPAWVKTGYPWTHWLAWSLKTGRRLAATDWTAEQCAEVIGRRWRRVTRAGNSGRVWEYVRGGTRDALAAQRREPEAGERWTRGVAISVVVLGVASGVALAALVS